VSLIVNGPIVSKVIAFRLCTKHLSRLEIFFPPLALQPILGLGRIHETSRFISVTKFRTVGMISWTGDQLVARPLLTAPGDCDDVEVGGMNGF
jgi:hypothetical protein